MTYFTLYSPFLQDSIRPSSLHVPLSIYCLYETRRASDPQNGVSGLASQRPPKLGYAYAWNAGSCVPLADLTWPNS